MNSDKIISKYESYRKIHPVLITNNYNDWKWAKSEIKINKLIRRKHWPIYYNDKGFYIFHVFPNNPWAIGWGSCIGADTNPDDFVEFDNKKWYTGGMNWMPTEEDKKAFDWESFTDSDIDEWELEYGIGKYNTKELGKK